MMFLLFSLLAMCGRALGAPGCNAIELEDVMLCVDRLPFLCEAGSYAERCRYDNVKPHRIAMDDQTQCLANVGKSKGQACNTHADCAYECGIQCVEFGGEKHCDGCQDAYILDYCNTANQLKHGLKCTWVGSDEYEGYCLDTEATCYGKKPEDQLMCEQSVGDKKYDAKTCLVSSGCAFGLNPWKLQARAYQNCATEGGFYAKVCSTTDDCTQVCSTGQACMDWGLGKSCAGCYDAGIKSDCDALAAEGLHCVWSGMADDDGMCIADWSKMFSAPTAPPTQTPAPTTPPTSTPAPVTPAPTIPSPTERDIDPCREFSLDSQECLDMGTCGFEDDRCFTLVANRKVCKKRGKGEGDSMEDRGKDCEAILGCKWKVKSKRGREKGKCKFNKKKKD